MHISADESGIVRRVEVTPANVHDSRKLKSLISGEEEQAFNRRRIPGKQDVVQEAFPRRSRISIKAFMSFMFMVMNLKMGWNILNAVKVSSSCELTLSTGY